MSEEHQQLILQPNATPTGWPPWSEGLGRLLLPSSSESHDGSSSGAVRIIAINPKLRAECERLLPILERERSPASPAEILMILVRNAPTYGIRAANDGEWAALFQGYVEALNGLPASAIEDAFLRWNRGEGDKNPMMREFYPKPPQLVHLAQDMRAKLFAAAHRARKALEYVDATIPRITPEEAKQRRADLQALAAELGSRSRQPMIDVRPSRTPQQMAEELRAAAARVDEVL